VRSPNSQSLPRGGADSLVKGRYRDALAEGRARTLAMVEPVSTEDMDRVHDPLMSPLVWDLGHIAAFEDLWLGQRAGGRAPLRPELSAVYDASETPRAERGDIPYLRRRDALAFMDAVRERSLDVLERADLSSSSDRLNANGFVWEMLVRHEHQHSETMLQTLQLAAPGTYAPTPRSGGAGGHRSDGTVMIEAGEFALGADSSGFAYDNERPRHTPSLAAYAIDRSPVSNGEYAEFVADGGYSRPELWTREGWRWRAAHRIERPLFWRADGSERQFERVAEIAADHPVMHVSWFEADAFARWAGARLPTEAEWEKAATWDSRRSRSRPYPWGYEPPGSELANLDQTAFGPQPIGSLDGVSQEGVGGLIGDCWEWTSTDFGGYPGFKPFPYPQYSQVFFGLGYKVLRGGSWATRRHAASTTFRNWDLPERRQIFSGFRCVRES